MEGESRPLSRTADGQAIESKPSASNEHVRSATEDAPKQLETSYVEGLPLVLVMGAVSIASFLVLLDTSIIATVSCFCHGAVRLDGVPSTEINSFTGYSPNHFRFPLAQRHQLVWLSVSVVKACNVPVAVFESSHAN